MSSRGGGGRHGTDPSMIKDVDSAKQYLSKNSVHMLFEHLACSVINEQPEEPVLYCYRTIEKMMTAEELERARAGGGGGGGSTGGIGRQNGAGPGSRSSSRRGSKTTGSESGEGGDGIFSDKPVPVYFILPPLYPEHPHAANTGSSPSATPIQGSLSGNISPRNNNNNNTSGLGGSSTALAFLDFKTDCTDRVASERDDFVTTSMGDLLRAEAARGSELGDEIQEFLSKESDRNVLAQSGNHSTNSPQQQPLAGSGGGKQVPWAVEGSDVPTEICLEVLGNWLRQQPRTTFEGQPITVLVHDFPRNMKDAVGLERKLKKGAGPASSAGGCFQPPAGPSHGGSSKNNNNELSAKVEGVFAARPVLDRSQQHAILLEQHQQDPLVDYYSAWEAIKPIELGPLPSSASPATKRTALHDAYVSLCQHLGLEPTAAPPAAAASSGHPKSSSAANTPSQPSLNVSNSRRSTTTVGGDQNNRSRGSSMRRKSNSSQISQASNSSKHGKEEGEKEHEQQHLTENAEEAKLKE